MSFLQKVKDGLGRAAEEASEFAQLARLRMEIGRLTDRKHALLLEIGNDVFGAYAAGGTVADVEGQCQEVAKVEGDIKIRQAEIERLQQTAVGPASESPADAPPAAAAGEDAVPPVEEDELPV